MKRILLAIILVLALAFPVSVCADDVIATASWTQPDYENVNYWYLYWGETSGGPYSIDSIKIDKDILAPEQVEDVIIFYPNNAKTTYYFVLVAFKDADHHSGNSNVWALEVDFIGNPQAPIQFQIIIKPSEGG